MGYEQKNKVLSKTQYKVSMFYQLMFIGLIYQGEGQIVVSQIEAGF